MSGPAAGEECVVDASSLIVLAKAGGLELLPRLWRRVSLTPAVHREVVERGKQHGRREAYTVEQALATGELALLVPTPEEQALARAVAGRWPSLGAVDCEVIAVADKRGLPLLIEDRRARRAALARGVSCVPLQTLPFLAFARRVAPWQECDRLMAELSELLAWEVPLVETSRQILRYWEAERQGPP